LTSFPEEDLVHKALEAGATSYLLKHVGAAELTLLEKSGGRQLSTAIVTIWQA